MNLFFLFQAPDEHLSESSLRVARVLAHTQIKTMSNAPPSCSDEEGESSLHLSNSQSSSMETDADESDHAIQQSNKPIVKPRRLQKTRKTSVTIVGSTTKNNTPPTSRTNVRKDEQKHPSSSNDDEINDMNGTVEDFMVSNRRPKAFQSRRHDHLTTTTTTDDDTNRSYHRYHPLDNLEANGKHFPSDSHGSSPVPTTAGSINLNLARKSNRFQVKSIRKSQQQHMLLANIAAAKSSNDDDCSVPSQRMKSLFKTAVMTGRKHTNTPTTDGEHPTTNTDHIVKGALSALTIVDNGSGSDIGNHHVRFHDSQNKKHESAAEEEKLPAPIVTLPTPAPPSSAASAQGEVRSRRRLRNAITAISLSA